MERHRFSNGRDLAARPDAGRAIAAAGHEIGNHTYNHRRMVFVSDETVRADGCTFLPVSQLLTR
ncbi:polysaccharide deacetylase family protein [Nocardia xishanensis]